MGFTTLQNLENKGLKCLYVLYVSLEPTPTLVQPALGPACQILTKRSKLTQLLPPSLLALVTALPRPSSSMKRSGDYTLNKAVPNDSSPHRLWYCNTSLNNHPSQPLGTSAKNLCSFIHLCYGSTVFLADCGVWLQRKSSYLCDDRGWNLI